MIKNKALSLLSYGLSMSNFKILLNIEQFNENMNLSKSIMDSVLFIASTYHISLMHISLSINLLNKFLLQ